MAISSPLEHEELRHIEKSLDAGNLADAAQRLARFANSQAHQPALTFLATRLLFQRGRIDADGAADRLAALLEQVDHFPEAEDWLAELEGRTERTAPYEGAALSAPDLEEDTAPSHPPPSHAPSVPRTPGPSHPYFEDTDADEVTPAEFPSPDEAFSDVFGADSSEPPPRPARAAASAPPPTLGGSRPPAPPRPSHQPFDSLRAKERLAARAGRYRASSYPDELRDAPSRRRSESAAEGAAVADVRRRVAEAWEQVLRGELERARALIPEEPSPAELDPELRVALARLLLDTGNAERAAAEAGRALQEAPDLPEARLLFVWSAVRYARQRDDAWFLERAGQILKEGNLEPAPEAGLLLALTACVEARVGTPAVALRLAQRALRSHAESVDGLAALAEAAALCGEEARSEAALERLFGVSESAAEQITPRLRRMGVGEQGPTSSASVWLPLEHTLSSGARDVALEGVEVLARDRLAGIELARPEQWQAAGTALSEFLTLAPVFRHFGRYDFTLASLERLEAVLGLLYGTGPRALDVEGSSRALWQVLGVYLGETLRHDCDGRWCGGDVVELAEARLDVAGEELKPFQIVRHRIAHGRHATLASALGSVVAAPRGAAQAAAPAVAPPPPWGSREWPALEDLPRLGRALGHSVLAVFGASHGVTALDRSSKSLGALDRYLELIVPASAPLAETCAWARWLAGLLGAYFGEVLCKELGGVWVRGESAGPRSVAIQLAGHRIEPLALLLGTVSGGSRTSLENYANELRRAAGRSEIPQRVP